MQSGQVTEDVVVSVTASATERAVTLSAGLEKLEDAVQEGEGYRAVCPICSGHGFIIHERNGTVRYQCKAGCKQADVTKALHDLGIYWPLQQQHVYTDEHGKPLFIKVRLPKTAKVPYYYKCFGKNGVPLSHNSKNKGTNGANGRCKRCGNGRPTGILYNRQAVAQAIANGDEIWLVEGEKDADILIENGVCATSSMNGVDDWNPAYSDQLNGARVVIIVADNDKHNAGKRGAYNRYLSLDEKVEKRFVRIAKHGKDSYDHFRAGYKLNDFVDVPISELEALAQLSNGDPIDATDPLPGEDWTNAGYAARFIELHGHEVIRVGDDWYVWNGAQWEFDERRKVLDFSWRLSKRMTAVANEQVDQDGKRPYATQSLKLQGAGNIAGTLTLASARLTFPQRVIDRDMTLLALRNGVYAGGGAFEPHDPLKLYTKCIDMTYDPEAECREWLRFLRSSIPDEAQRKYLQTLLGFAMVGGDRKKKRIVNLIGPKDTGKSTFLRVIGDILGPYMQTPAVDELVSHGRGSSDKFALSELRGARIAAISETDAGSRFRVAPLKALTGGDIISTQSKNKNPIQWRASVMLLIATNEQIAFDMRDQAFLDRCVYIEFARRRRIDRDLGAKLEAEKAGILRWLLDGVDAYMRDELAEPESVKRSRETAAESLSTPLQFIRFGLDSEALVSVGKDFPVSRCCQVKPLFNRYEAWCDREEIPPKKRSPFKDFSEVVGQRYPKAKGRGVFHFTGIASKTSVDTWKSPTRRKSS